MPRNRGRAGDRRARGSRLPPRRRRASLRRDHAWSRPLGDPTDRRDITRADTHPHARSNSNANSDADADADTDTDSNSNAYSDSDPHSNSDPDPNSDSDPDTDPDPNSDLHEDQLVDQGEQPD